MTEKARSILTYTVLVIVGLCFLFWGLVQGRSFLLPLTVAMLLSMIILPVCRWFENKGLKRGWASFFSDMIVVLFFVGLASVIAAQFDNLEEDWPQIKEKVKPRIEKLQEYIARKTGLSVKEQNQQIPGSFSNSESKDTNRQGQEDTSQPQTSSGQGQTGERDVSFGGSLVSTASDMIMRFFSILGTLLLIFVYIFFFLLYRNKFKQAILKMVPEQHQEHAQKVIQHSASVSQSYLFGRILLLLFLAVLYTLGLTLSGLKNAVLISMLAAVLSLLPYLGNVIGFTVAILMAFISGSGITGAIGVSVTFTITQFVESYVLEPYVVGNKVDLNPTITIIVVVLGGSIWGIVGMLISIPILGIIKVVCDNVTVLQPLGYLFGEEDIRSGYDIKNIFKRTKR